MAYTGTLNDKYYTSSSKNPQNLTQKGYPDSKDGSGGRLISSSTGTGTLGANPGGSMTGNNAGLYKTSNYINRSATTPTGGGGGGGTSKSGSTGTTNAYANLLSAYLNGSGSGNNMQSYLDASMSARANALQNNLNSSIEQLRAAYDNSASRIRQDAEESLRQAYINKMISQKNMQQQMSAMGLGGGATETSLASLFNNYGNSRNNIETTKANNLSDLDYTLNSNLANVLNNYNTQMANLEGDRLQYQMQLENAAQDRQVAAMDRYYYLIGKLASSKNPNAYLSALNNAIASVNGFQFTPTEATNLVNLVNTTQANTDPTTMNKLQLLSGLYNNNSNNGTTEVSYGNAGGTDTASLLKQLLAQYGLA